MVDQIRVLTTNCTLKTPKTYEKAPKNELEVQDYKITNIVIICEITSDNNHDQNM